MNKPIPTVVSHANSMYKIRCGFRSRSDCKESACNAGDSGSVLGSERSPEKEMATHSSTLARRIPWTEEPGRLQSMASQRVGHNWVTNTLTSFSRLLKSIWQQVCPFSWYPCQGVKSHVLGRYPQVNEFLIIRSYMNKVYYHASLKSNPRNTSSASIDTY